MDLIVFLYGNIPVRAPGVIDRAVGHLIDTGDAGESLSGIRIALSRALRQRPRIRNSTPYGDRRTGRHLARILARTPLNEPLRRKKNTF